MNTLIGLRRLAAAMAWMGLALGAASAQPRAVPLGTGERITLDGRLDEAAWRAAPHHDAFVQFLKRDRGGAMQRAMQRHAWAEFAAAYNGSSYAANGYDKRLKAAYEKVPE